MTQSLKLLTRAVALFVCAALTAPACAAVTASKTPPPPVPDHAVLAEYVQKLTPGSTVKVARVNGKTMRGTLMKATDQELVLQPRTRVPEAPVQIPLADVVSVTPEASDGTNVAKAIGVGAAAGAAAALGVFLILLAALSD